MPTMQALSNAEALDHILFLAKHYGKERALYSFNAIIRLREAGALASAIRQKPSEILTRVMDLCDDGEHYSHRAMGDSSATSK